MAGDACISHSDSLDGFGRAAGVVEGRFVGLRGHRGVLFSF